MDSDKIDDLRCELDGVDESIIALVEQRLDIVAQLAPLKTTIIVPDERRRRREMYQVLGKYGAKLYRVLHEMSVEVQK